MDNNQTMNTAAPVSEKKSGHHWMHLGCCWYPIFRALFWFAGVVAFVLAWVAGDATAWGFSSQFWFVNAITLGILAAGTPKGKRCYGGCCGKGMCASGTCSVACTDCK